MNRFDNLTLRTTTALGRLASLQRRADKSPAPPSLVRDALEELSTALEELRVANETLVEQASEVTVARNRDQQGKRDLQALFLSLPIACLFTDRLGHIFDANPYASRLLNVGRQHLTGKPLYLFLMERDAVMQALETPPASGEFEQVTIVRPRERRPREIHLRGVRMPTGDQWCWYLQRPGASEDGE